MALMRNLRLKNSDDEFVTYTSILFFDDEDWSHYDMDGGTVIYSTNNPPYKQYYDLINDIVEQRTGYPEILKYGKPIVSGLTSNADVLTENNNKAYAFATAIPTIFAPFGPWRQGQTSNEIILNGERFAFFGTSGSNEAGAYTIATSLVHYLNPIPDTTSKVVIQNTGIIAQQQQGSALWCYFLCCRVTDIEDPWNTIDKWNVMRIGLYYSTPQRLFCQTNSGAIADNATYEDFLDALKHTNPDDRFIPGAGEDPNEAGGTSGPGGGGGNFDATSDPIDIPNMPSLDALDTGFVTIYAPTLIQVKDLSSYLWAADMTKIEYWKKIVANPMDLILGFGILPVDIPREETPSQVVVGSISTDVDMYKATAQYVEVDCGTVDMQEYWGSALDYEPNTKATIYLPYCGYHDLSIDETMNATIGVKYHVDILSGACICYVTVNNNVMYSYTGNCLQQIPITAADYSQKVASAIAIAGSIAAVAATGGAAAPVAAGAGAGAAELSGAAAANAGMLFSPAQIGAGIGIGMTTANNVMGLKPKFTRSGSISGDGGQMARQKPYIIITRARQSLAKNYKDFCGYPSNITAKLGDLKGYTEVESIHLEGIPATPEELAGIEAALKAGIIIN